MSIHQTGTCIPICAWAIAARLLRPLRTPPIVIYVESVCRVKDLSVTGKLLYYFADVFIVQWQQLHARYPRSQYFGLLV